MEIKGAKTIQYFIVRHREHPKFSPIALLAIRHESRSDFSHGSNHISDNTSVSIALISKAIKFIFVAHCDQ